MVDEGAAVSLRKRAKRLTVLVGETDRWHHKPLYTEIVHRAHTAGLAGASVLRGIEGYGVGRHVHTTRILSLSEDLPVAVVIVDAADRVDAFLAELDEIVAGGIAVIDDVEVVTYGGTSRRS
jgi:uncharacterized protein